MLKYESRERTLPKPHGLCGHVFDLDKKNKIFNCQDIWEIQYMGIYCMGKLHKFSLFYRWGCQQDTVFDLQGEKDNPFLFGGFSWSTVENSIISNLVSIYCKYQLSAKSLSFILITYIYMY